MTLRFGPRRGTYLDATDLLARGPAPLTAEERAPFETLDLVYRSLCALLFNYVPTSGHPGGSISSGRFVAALLFDALDYDLARPDREGDEIARLAAPALLPADTRQRLRLEDLLGFRRNPVVRTPLVERFGARALDGDPPPAAPC